jgi:hypothetical protein
METSLSLSLMSLSTQIYFAWMALAGILLPAIIPLLKRVLPNCQEFSPQVTDVSLGSYCIKGTSYSDVKLLHTTSTTNRAQQDDAASNYIFCNLHITCLRTGLLLLFLVKSKK